MQNSYARFIKMIVVFTSKVTSVIKHYAIDEWVKAVRIVSLCYSGTSGVELLCFVRSAPRKNALVGNSTDMVTLETVLTRRLMRTW